MKSFPTGLVEIAVPNLHFEANVNSLDQKQVKRRFPTERLAEAAII